MKKFLSILLVLTMVIGLLPAIGAFAASNPTSEDGSYVITFGTKALTGSSSSGYWSATDITFGSNGEIEGGATLDNVFTITLVDATAKTFKIGFNDTLLCSYSNSKKVCVVGSTTSGNSVLWVVEDAGNDTYYLKNVGTSKYLALSSYGTFGLYAEGDAEGKSAVSFIKHTISDPLLNVTISGGLITSNNKLAENKEILIVSKTHDKIMSTNGSTNYRGETDATKSGNDSTPHTVSGNGYVQKVTLKAASTSGSWLLQIADDTYLCSTTGTSNNVTTTNDETNVCAHWNITISADGIATIKAGGEGDRKYLRHNNDNTRFSCYAEGSQNDVLIYMVGDTGAIPGVVQATKVDNIAAAKAVAANTKIEVTGVVTYTNGYAKVYIQDSTGAIQVTMAANASCVAGDTITVTATMGSNGALTGGTYVAATTPIERVAKEVSSVAALEATDVGTYVKVSGLTVSEIDGDYTYLSDGTDEIVVYKMVLGSNELCVGDSVDITAVLDYYNDYQLRNTANDPLTITPHANHANAAGEYASDDTNHWQVCDTCGRPFGTTAHVDTATKDHNCDVCGKESISQHSYSEATCKAKATCSHCGATTGELGGHTDTNDDLKCDICQANLCSSHTDADPKDHKCDDCGYAMSQHTYSDASCTAPKTCSYCGATEGDKLAHDWADATTEAPKTCKICGATEGDKLASAPAVPSVQANPVAGTGYIFGLQQVSKEQTLFFTGEMNGYYLALSEDVSEAVEVKMEAVDGGYHLSFTKDGKKQYIDIVPRTGDGNEGKVNVVITEEPTAVFVYDKDLKTFTTVVSEKTWYLGTYGTYTTISASEIKYITGDNAANVGVSQYIAQMYAVGSGSSSVPSNGDTTLSTIVALMVISAMGMVALVSKKKEF